MNSDQSLPLSSESSRRQSYVMPSRLKTNLFALFLNGLCLSAFGGFLLFMTEQVGTSWFALGLLCHVLGLMFILGFGIALYCLTTRMEFTMDSVFIYQFGRRVVQLPYNEYSFQWIADVPSVGNVRLLMIDYHRGCTIWNPPSWIRENLTEISRIQQEEGWYAPQEVSPGPPRFRKQTPTKVS